MKTVSKKLLSLMLVAILLVSALPFQAFATEPDGSDAAVAAAPDAVAAVAAAAPAAAPATPTPEKHDANLPTHALSPWKYNAGVHWNECTNPNCEYAGQRLNENAHVFDANGVCTVCGNVCDHNEMLGTVDVPGSAVEADCIHEGKTADIACAECGVVLEKGTVIPATGVHDWDANGVCKVCHTKQEGAACKLTLDADGGTVGGGSSLIVDVQQGYPIQTLPDPVRPGYKFMGWYINGTRINVGTVYNFGEVATATAKWVERTQHLTVRRVLNGNFSTAYTIFEEEVPENTPLLTYLNANISAKVQAALPAGYRWESNFWKDYSGTQPLTTQDTVMNQAQTVYVNFVSNAYTLFFDAGNGTVTPTSKTVYFGSAVGTLPTPTLSGKVFRGWKDANGIVYDSTTVYQIASNSTLTAVWDNESLVMLYIHVNGNFSSCDRMILMDKYVINDNISRADVLKEVAKYYAARPGYTLSIAGLFDENTWASYRANTSKAGVENIGVSDKHLNKIYVMVNNAQSGTTILPTNPTTVTVPNNGNAYYVVTGNGTGYWVNGTAPQGSYWVSTGNGNGYWSYNPSNYPTNVIYPTYVYVPGSNPKTGDTARIEIAAAVMVLAAAALVTMMALRKKKA